jgi:hypothetical protein
LIRIVLTALAGVGALILTSAAGGVTGPDVVSGTGQRVGTNGQPLTIHVDAQSGTAGQGVTGDFWVMADTALGRVTLRGPVTCLTVEGNRAAARGTITESTAPDAPVGTIFQIQVTDNGSPGPLADTNINFSGFGPEETGCAIIPFSERSITQGNFVVEDR